MLLLTSRDFAKSGLVLWKEGKKEGREAKCTCVYTCQHTQMATLRGSPRNGEVDAHITVSGYDDSQNGDGDRRHGSLLDDGKRKKPRGIGKSIQNFFLVKLRYDPTVAVILLMVVAAIALVVCALIFLPVFGDPDVDPKKLNSAKRKVTTGVDGYDGYEGLVEPTVPEEITAEDLPSAKNGDKRFTFNERVYAMSSDGGLYVAAEDIVQPAVKDDGTYNFANARQIRYKPGRVLFLPEIITREEEAILLREGDAQFSAHPRWTSGAGGQGNRVAAFPNSTAVQETIMKRIQHFVGLNPSFAQPWVYRVDNNTNPGDAWEDFQQNEGDEEMDETKTDASLQQTIHHDFAVEGAQNEDFGRVVSGILFLTSLQGPGKGELEGGGSIFVQDNYIDLMDIVLLQQQYSLPRLKTLEKFFTTYDFGMGMTDLESYDDGFADRRAKKKDIIKERRIDAVKASRKFWAEVDFLCELGKKKADSKLMKSYMDDFLNLKGMFKIKAQPRSIIIYDNVFTKHLFRDAKKTNPLRSAFHGMCQEIGARKSYNIFFKNNEKDAKIMRDKYYDGSIPVLSIK